MTALAQVARQSRDITPATGVVRHFKLTTVAEILDCSLSSVYELIDRGDLVAVSVPGRGKSRTTTKRVREDDLIAFQDRLRADATATQPAAQSRRTA